MITSLNGMGMYEVIAYSGGAKLLLVACEIPLFLPGPRRFGKPMSCRYELIRCISKKNKAETVSYRNSEFLGLAHVALFFVPK